MKNAATIFYFTINVLKFLDWAYELVQRGRIPNF